MVPAWQIRHLIDRTPAYHCQMRIGAVGRRGAADTSAEAEHSVSPAIHAPGTVIASMGDVTVRMEDVWIGIVDM
jgi:hypothetical protein